MYRILICEDEQSLRDLLVEKFTQAGYEVLSAPDGEEGLASALKNHPDVMLIDVMMPKMDGLTLLGKLKADPWGKDVPLMMLTNADDSAHISQAINLKAPHYLIKSDWNIDDLVKEVTEYTERSQRLQEVSTQA